MSDIYDQHGTVMHILSDLIHYHVLPYLHISAAALALARADVKAAIITSQCQYTQPHGIHQEDIGIVYYRNGRRHRDAAYLADDVVYINGVEAPSGPAMMLAIPLPGGKVRIYGQYFDNGLLHRVDGPAIDWGNGATEWYLRGEHHREDGPAVIFSDDEVEYWVAGVQCADIGEYEYQLDLWRQLNIQT